MHARDSHVTIRALSPPPDAGDGPPDRRRLHLRERAAARPLAGRALGSAGRLDHREHAHDPSLGSLIDVVPFGIDAEAPAGRRPGTARCASRHRRPFSGSALGRRYLGLVRPAHRNSRRARAVADAEGRPARLPRPAPPEQRCAATTMPSRLSRSLVSSAWTARLSCSTSNGCRTSAGARATRGGHRRVGAFRRPRDAVRLPHAPPRLLVGGSARRHDPGDALGELVEQREPRRRAARRGRRSLGAALEALLDDEGARRGASERVPRCGGVSSGAESWSRSRASWRSPAGGSSRRAEYTSPACASSTCAAESRCSSEAPAPSRQCLAAGFRQPRSATLARRDR